MNHPVASRRCVGHDITTSCVRADTTVNWVKLLACTYKPKKPVKHCDKQPQPDPTKLSSSTVTRTCVPRTKLVKTACPAARPWSQQSHIDQAIDLTTVARRTRQVIQRNISFKPSTPASDKDRWFKTDEIKRHKHHCPDRTAASASACAASESLSPCRPFHEQIATLHAEGQHRWQVSVGGGHGQRQGLGLQQSRVEIEIDNRKSVS